VVPLSSQIPSSSPLCLFRSQKYTVWCDKQKNVKLKLRSNHADATTEVLTNIPWQKPRRVKVCPIWSDYYTPPKTDNLTIPYNTPFWKRRKHPTKSTNFEVPLPTPHLWEPWMVSRTPRGHLRRRLGGSTPLSLQKPTAWKHTNQTGHTFFQWDTGPVSMSHHGFNKYLHCWILWNCWPLVWGFWCICFTMQGKNKHTENQG